MWKFVFSKRILLTVTMLTSALALVAPLPAQSRPARQTAVEGNSKLVLPKPTTRMARPGPGYRHPDDFVPPAPPPEPPGVRAYSADMHDPFDLDRGPAAIRLVGARNGVFSGKVVVASGEAVAGLKAAMSDLKGPGGAILAANVEVRYAFPWDSSFGGRAPPGRDVLQEAAPAEVAPVKGRVVIPVWITVRVPKDAPAGEYAGTLAIQAAGRQIGAVLVKLSVRAWTIPDAQDWRTWLEMIESPDTLAVEYETPLWSAKHFALIDRSFRLISGSGSRMVYVPLICRTNLGNEQSMLRWIKKGDRYEPDYTVVDQYLDSVGKNLGTPKIVSFWAWDAWMNPPSGKMITIAADDPPFAKEEKTKLMARAELAKEGVPVTAFDPATGKSEEVFLAKYATPEGKALWAPVWKTLRAKMKARGWEQAMQIGCMTDWQPTKEDALALKELTGDLPWTSCSHHCAWRNRPSGQDVLFGVASVGLTTLALSFELTINPAHGRTYGWQRPLLHAQFWRGNYLNVHSISTLRHEGETQITGNQRGLGRLGGDFWPCVRDKRGRRAGIVTDRWPASYWHNLNVENSFLAPGPNGALATVRFEAVREGYQECEARIALESVLTDPVRKAKLGAALAQRAQDFLDEQQRNMWRARGAQDEDMVIGTSDYRTYDYDIVTRWKENAGNEWFIQSGWADRVGQLFELAHDVAAKAGAKQPGSTMPALDDPGSP